MQTHCMGTVQDDGLSYALLNLYNIVNTRIYINQKLAHQLSIEATTYILGWEILELYRQFAQRLLWCSWLLTMKANGSEKYRTQILSLWHPGLSTDGCSVFD